MPSPPIGCEPSKGWASLPKEALTVPERASSLRAAPSVVVWSVVDANLKVDHDAEMIADPDSVDWLVEGECCGLNACAGFGMSIPAGDQSLMVSPLSGQHQSSRILSRRPVWVAQAIPESPPV